MDSIFGYVMLVILAIAGVVYVGHVNRQDTELIKQCQHDPGCVNPWSGERFGK